MTSPQYDPSAPQSDPNAASYGQQPGAGFTQPPPPGYDQQPNPAGYAQPPGPGYGQPSNPYVAPGYGTPNQMGAGSLAAVVRKRALKQVAIGAVIFAIGLIITVATFSNASSSSGGGTYIVAWGPMILGIVWMVRGLIALSKAGKLNR
jgi:hypothetical protein